MYNLNGKNVLVTGGAGFVGSHLTQELIKLKAHVVVADLLLDKTSYFFTEKLYKQSTVIRQDICNYKKLLALIKKHKIDFIFHLAAQALVERAYIDPKNTLENNIISTINILEAVRANSRIKGVVVASSDKAYGDLHKKKYKETDPLSGDSPYEVSKSATDLICTSYFKTYKTPVVITRFGNIYGEGDFNFSRIVPGIMKALVEKKRLKIRSNGKLIRDYLYVKDVVQGYVLLAKNIDTAKGEAFNFGSNDTLSVLKVIQTANNVLKRNISYTIHNTVVNEIPYQSLDYSKIQKKYNWRPRTKMSEILPVIFDWYKTIAP